MTTRTTTTSTVRTRSMTATETRSAVAHLGRRAGFGLAAAEVDELAADGYEAAVEHLLAGLVRPDPAADAVAPPTFDTARLLADLPSEDPATKKAANRALAAERRALIRWWVERMTVAESPLHEKLTFLWHDHFATSLAKVRYAEPLFVQNRTLHELGPGRFDTLLHALARDPAMLIWLDGRENRRGAPNENFARELLELFTLGHGAGPGRSSDQADDTHSAGHTGAQPYTEDDVADAARALTGWRIDLATRTGVLISRRHDDGVKTLLGTTGRLGLDEVVDLTTGDPACAPHVVSRLWSRLGRPAGPGDEVVLELAGPFARDLDTTALLRRLFLHPAFLETGTRAALVKTPVEWVVGSLRALGHPLPQRIEYLLVALGQVPFAPPDVAGWPTNAAWLSTASARVRLQAATAIAGTADLGPIEAARPADRPATVGRLLGVDDWGSATGRALTDAADRPKTLLALALVAPEHLLA